MKDYKVRYCETCGRVILKHKYEGITRYNKRRFCKSSCFRQPRVYVKKVEFYSIKSLCKCGCGKVIFNPDSHYRYRDFIYGHANKNGNHPRLGVTQTEAEVTKRIKAMFRHFREKQPTYLEKELYWYLDNSDAKYEPQKQFGRTIVDAFIPELKLAIYADGRYWHDKPEVVERDKRNEIRLRKRDIDVLRLSSIDNGYHLDLEPLKSVIG